jgi:hypothetical protein
VRAKPGELKCQWGRANSYDSPDICYIPGEGVARCDLRLLHLYFASPRNPMQDLKTFLDELTERGYDIKTLRFSIQKKKDPAPIRAAVEREGL